MCAHTGDLGWHLKADHLSAALQPCRTCCSASVSFILLFSHALILQTCWVSSPPVVMLEIRQLWYCKVHLTTFCADIHLLQSVQLMLEMERCTLNSIWSFLTQQILVFLHLYMKYFRTSTLFGRVKDLNSRLALMKREFRKRKYNNGFSYFRHHSKLDIFWGLVSLSNIYLLESQLLIYSGIFIYLFTWCDLWLIRKRLMQEESMFFSEGGGGAVKWGSQLQHFLFTNHFCNSLSCLLWQFCQLWQHTIKTLNTQSETEDGQIPIWRFCSLSI